MLSPYFGMGGARCCLSKLKQSLEVVDCGGHIGLLHRGPPDVSAGRGHLQTYTTGKFNDLFIYVMVKTHVPGISTLNCFTMTDKPS